MAGGGSGVKNKKIKIKRGNQKREKIMNITKSDILQYSSTRYRMHEIACDQTSKIAFSSRHV